VIRAATLAALGLALVLPMPRRAGAQASAPLAAPELRADAILGRRPAIQIGAGVQIPVGYYVRVGVTAAVGGRIDDAASRPASSSRVDGRVDVLARFLLDPFRQTPYGLSFGGGIGLRAEPGDRARPVLLVALDVEGRRMASGWVPALQAGLGGGVRLGVVLRRGVAGAR
jgi:hypothetical protein